MVLARTKQTKETMVCERTLAIALEVLACTVSAHTKAIAGLV